MSVTVTTHERPGVYSVYDTSGLVRSSGVKNVAVIAMAESGDGTVAYPWYTCAQAMEAINGSEMAELVRLLFLNGAAMVYGVPVTEESQYETAIATVDGLENVALVLCDSEELGTQQALRDSVVNASGARRERIAVVPGGKWETVAELCIRAQALNSERVVLAAPGVMNETGADVGCARCAAAVAGAIAGESDPAVPLGGAELSGLNGLSARYSDSEIDALVQGGVTAVESVGGVIRVVRGITTRTQSGGAPDASWRELTTILIVDEVIPGIRQALRSRFQRAKNTAQGRNAIRSQVILELENRVNREIITDYEDVTVTALEEDPTVCLVEFAFTVAHGLNQIWLSAHITI